MWVGSIYIYIFIVTLDMAKNGEKICGYVGLCLNICSLAKIFFQERGKVMTS